MKILSFILSFGIWYSLGAQHQIKIESIDKEPIEGAIIYYDQKAIGKSDQNGSILLESLGSNTYEIRRLGYKEYKGVITTGHGLIILERIQTKGAEIKGKKYDMKKEVAKEVIDQCELGKLACCNLAESFENSNTVDVNYSDGITGGREIQMLGLAGMYSQQLLEGMPYQRGILSKVGLELVPGPWLEAIGINKGVGSVVNGFDNISGQINLEYAKPKKSLDWFLNAYTTEILKTDLNLIKGWQLKENLYTSVMAHSQFSRMTMDNNHDGFTDMPVFSNFNLMNRWQYIGEQGLMVNAALQATRYQYEAGQILEHSHHQATDPYVISQTTQAYHAMIKTGWELDAVKEASFAILTRLTYADQAGRIDKRQQDNQEMFFNISPIYQTNLDTNWKWKLGGQLLYDKVDESLDTLRFAKNEIVPGAFTELMYRRSNLLAIMGLRGDYHNTLGFFASPRASIQFTPNDHHILKISSGLGFRTPSILTDASSFLVSNRRVSLPSELQAERGWNSGLSYKYLLDIFGQESSIELSYYLTLFQNQMIINVETPELLKVEYLKDQSRAQSFQVDANLKFPKGFALRLSYKNDRTSAFFDGNEKLIPLLKNDKYLANFYWADIHDKWRFSTTFLVNGPARIPALTGRSESYSPYFFTTHAQVNYTPTKKMDIYIGAENIFSYTQEDRIYLWQNTASSAFDAGMIWGPMDVRRMYVGAKVKL